MVVETDIITIFKRQLDKCLNRQIIGYNSNVAMVRMDVVGRRPHFCAVSLQDYLKLMIFQQNCS